jgi:hypothetical protein
MRVDVVGAVVAVLAFLQGAPMPLFAQEKPSSKPSDSKAMAAVKAVVTNFYKNWEQGHATRNQPMFLSPDTPTVGIAPDHRPGRQTVVWQKKAGELLKEWEANPPKYLELNSVEVDQFGESLAVARATYSGSAIKGRAVFTLSSEAGVWRIASLVLETRFNW